MKVEKAIEIITHPSNCEFKDYVKALGKIIEEVEYRIALKPIEEYSKNEYGVKYPILVCPRCEKMVCKITVSKTVGCCWNCGQKLDWE